MRRLDAPRETLHVVDHAQIDTCIPRLQFLERCVMSGIGAIKRGYMYPVGPTAGRFNRGVDQFNRTAEIGRRERRPAAEGA